MLPMTRLKILRMSTLSLGFVGLGALAVPFIGSLAPGEATRAAATVTVKISNIPPDGTIVADYLGYRAFVVREPEMQVFLMPYDDGDYLMPELTWERVYLRCGEFEIDSEGFSCKDPGFSDWWQDQMKWNRLGEGQGAFTPDLQTANYRVRGGYLILSPEYQ